MFLNKRKIIKIKDSGSTKFIKENSIIPNKNLDEVQNEKSIDSNLVKKDYRGRRGRRGCRGYRGRRGCTGPVGPVNPGSIEPKSSYVRIIYVNKAGNDDIANGSKNLPFLTVNAAMLSISNAKSLPVEQDTDEQDTDEQDTDEQDTDEQDTDEQDTEVEPDGYKSTKQYAIYIGPGSYTEPLIHLKANIQLIGTSTLLTRLSIPFDIRDVSWFNTNQDSQSGFSQLSLLSGPLDFNFNTVQNVKGKLFFDNVNITPIMVFTSSSTVTNEVNIQNSHLSNGYTQNGINMRMFSSFISNGNITINSTADVGTQVNLATGGINGNIIVNVQSKHIPIEPLNLTNFTITENSYNAPNSGNLIVNGVNEIVTRVKATVDSIPNKQKITIIGTASTLIRVDDAYGLSYTPNNLIDWNNTPPNTIQEALDRIAAKITPIP